MGSPRYSDHVGFAAKTIYIVGLPRSGKSSIYNVIASCSGAEGAEEPFELSAIAKKASSYPAGSREYRDWQDVFRACTTHLTVELMLGRNYNLRESDRSCVYNFKTRSHVKAAHANARKQDIVPRLKKSPPAIVLTLNDIENAIHFLASSSPNACFVHVRRNLFSNVCSINSKGWLTDVALAERSNLLPAYSAFVRKDGAKLHIPHVIPAKYEKAFAGAVPHVRAFMFACFQDKKLIASLSAVKRRYPCALVEFDSLRKDPATVLNPLLEKLGLKKGGLTDSIIKRLENTRWSDLPSERGIACAKTKLAKKLGELAKDPTFYDVFNRQ
jgi:hypothetical protein